MTGALLFARTRRWPLCLTLIALTGIAIIACGPLSYTLNPAGGYRVAAAAQAPLIAALTIQGALTPALPRQEQQAARSLHAWRLLHIAGLTAIAAAVVAIAALFLTPPTDVMVNANVPLGPIALVRDLLAFTGAALTAATLIGPNLAWVIPLAWAIIPATLTGPDPDPTGILRLPTQPDLAPIPLLAAASIWALGTTLATTRPRTIRSL